MKIKVTQEHIAKGAPDHANLCPIGLALKEMFPQKAIVVGKTEIGISNPWEARVWSLPFPARYFISEFDTKRPVAPFEFELEDLPANSSLTEQAPQVGDNFILSLDLTPQRNKLISTIRTLDEYETTILQAYANNLIKSRKERS